MATRRMLHVDVIQSDAFLEMPFSAQMLYVQINQSADDDGFCNGARRIARLIGAEEEDLKLLVEKRFLLDMDGVMVVKHWRMSNSLQSDRIKMPVYPEIARKLFLKSNRVYTDHPEEGAENLLSYRLRRLAAKKSGFQMDSQEKRNRKEEKLNEVEVEAMDSTEERKLFAMGGNLGRGVLMLTEEQTETLLDKMGIDCFEYYCDKLSSFILSKEAKIKNHYATILRWWQEDSRR